MELLVNKNERPMVLELQEETSDLLRRQKVIAELKLCSKKRDIFRGKLVHEAASRTGDDSHVFVASILISMYSKCGRMHEALQVFDRLETPDVVCWNALILGYADVGKGWKGLEVFSRMRLQGCFPDARTFVSVLKACTDLAEKEDGDVKVSSRNRGRKLHLLAMEYGFESDIYVQDTLVDLYAKCRSMLDAREVFDAILDPNVISWTALILGYADNGKGEISLELFLVMVRKGFRVDATGFVAALKACSDLSMKEEVSGKMKRVTLEKGRALHLLVISSGCGSDIYVQGILVDMYVKCGNMKEARAVFDDIKKPNVICWNALILGYSANGKGETALDLFSKMICLPDRTTFVAAIKACMELGERDVENCKLVDPALKEKGKRIQMLSTRNGCGDDLYVQGCLVDMYAKFGSMSEARAVFDHIKVPNVACWNALILGYKNNGECEIALKLFSRMRREGVLPNAFSFAIVLSACGILGALEVGKAFHAEILSCDLKGLKDNAVIATCLLDLYAKCGSLVEAEQAFHYHPTKDLVTWNALMTAYSSHGETNRVFDLFEELLRTTNLQPDHVTFNCLLTACSRAGLVAKGKDLFQEISSKYGLKPDVEHCTSMLDMLGRSNMLEDAMVLLRTMEFTPKSVTWTSILGACQTSKNVHLGRLAFECLVSFDKEKVGSYVAMGNIYGSKGMWAEKAEMHAMRMKLKVTITTEQSWWPDITGLVQTFCTNEV